MTKLGISIYPEIVGEKETIEYLNLCAKYNVKMVFANLLGVEDNEAGRERLAMFKRVFKVARDHGMEMMVDVNPGVYESFKLPRNEIKWFKELGATGLRLDEDFGGVVEAEISNNKEGMKLVLNPSTGIGVFKKTIENGGNGKAILSCHNFYPMRYTGVKYEQFIKNSIHTKDMGCEVAAFITLPEESKGVGPWNVNEGIPTLEEHRDLPLVDQAHHFLTMGFVDWILISQQAASEQQLKDLNKLFEEVEKLYNSQTIELDMELVNDKPLYRSNLNFDRTLEHHGHLFNKHETRSDFNAAFVRSTAPRLIYDKDEIKPDNAGKHLKRGDVIILNENLGRYKGEVHILLKDIDDSKQNARNLVGHIKEKDIFKLDFIVDGKTFKLNY